MGITSSGKVRTQLPPRVPEYFIFRKRVLFHQNGVQNPFRHAREAGTRKYILHDTPELQNESKPDRRARLNPFGRGGSGRGFRWTRLYRAGVAWRCTRERQEIDEDVCDLHRERRRSSQVSKTLRQLRLAEQQRLPHLREINLQRTTLPG